MGHGVPAIYNANSSQLASRAAPKMHYEKINTGTYIPNNIAKYLSIRI